MPSYKVTYFNITALGEPIRFLLSYGEQDFVDNRIELFSEEWTKLKPSMPFGQMPLLKVDGKPAHQHLAICRYLGKQFGIAGDNDWEALQIDIIADTVNDYRSKLIPTYWEDDKELKEKNYAEAIKTTIPYYLERINALAESGYLANGKLSWADLHLVSLLDYLNILTRFVIVDKYPNLKKVQNNVLSIPSIKAYLAKRPKTQL